MDTRSATFQMLSQHLFDNNPNGSLRVLRELVDRKHFPSMPNVGIGKDLVGFAHLSAFNLAEENGTYAASYFIQSGNTHALEELKRLAVLYNQPETLKKIKESELDIPDKNVQLPIGLPYEPRFVSEIDVSFRQYCVDHQLVILKTLQHGIEAIRRCSWVYLVWDTDGIVKVYKEILNYKRGRLGSLFNNEDELYERLPQNPFFPKHYGVVDVGGITFLRQSVHFGQTLADTLSSGVRVTPDEAGYLIHGVASALEFVHAHNIAYLDVKPENFMVSTKGVQMLDLGVSRIVQGSEEVDIYLADPRFATPEGARRLKGSKASDVFQMGVLFYFLLTGTHPFEQVPFFAEDLATHRESAILRYVWPTAVYASDFSTTIKGPYAELVKDMLDFDPQKRPTAHDVVEQLTIAGNFTYVHKSWRSTRQKTKNTILFPARMGIPHKGHIEYISRLLALGYHVLISIDLAHIITARDPIPKSFVMKIVAQSLIDLGFTPDVDFSFVFTPYYRTKQELEYHHLTMTQIDDVIAIASGNPQVHDLFADWAIFDQKAVFGTEGEKWVTQSWGEQLRNAVRQGDYPTFQMFAASGTEKILRFDEIRDMYGKPEIEFAKRVEVVLTVGENELCRGRIFRYHSPEQSIVFQMKEKGWKVTILQPYTRDTVIEINGQSARLVYLRTEFIPETGFESIYFHLRMDEPS